MNITEFLLARIAEDEVRARSLLANTQEGYDINEYAQRMIAECAAKRAIIVYSPPKTLQYLAAVYKEHPDYDPAWSPNAR